MPLSEPMQGVDGNPVERVFVPKGTPVMVCIRSVNSDPSRWGKDSYEWKPERWLSPLPEKVTDARLPGVFPNL